MSTPEQQALNPNNTDPDIREYPSFWQRKKKPIIAITIISVVLIGTIVLFGYLAYYYRTQAFKTVLADNLSVQNVIAHLKAFEAIANSSGGTRAAGTVGYNASGAYVLQKLQAVGYSPVIQYFPITTWTLVGTPTLQQIAPISATYTYNNDFGIFINSVGANNLTASVSAVLNYGCHAGDYTNFPSGSIALISRGNCTFLDKISNASAANASAAIIFNNAENGGLLYQARTNSSFTLPALTATLSFGNFLLQLLSLTSNVSLQINFAVTLTETVTYNILADTSTGRSNRVIVSGSHLDSVTAGPGINDNGSGSASNLEIALLVAILNLQPLNKIRFAWWGAEELGLLGSQFYVTNLQQTNYAEFKNIALNLNFDMIGSPNYMRGVYNGSSASNNINAGATIIQQLFENYFAAHQLPYTLTPFTGRSDYGPFINAGIPAGGLFTGAEGIKTAAERNVYGGLAGASYDPCYHKACDTVANINVHVLDDMSHAMAQIIQDLAYNETLVDQIVTSSAYRTSTKETTIS